jgi:hypothetical protein
VILSAAFPGPLGEEGADLLHGQEGLHLHAGNAVDLRGILRAVEQEMDQWQAFGAALGTEANLTGSPFPERLHINALVHRFMWEYSEAVRTWAIWAQNEVSRWEDVSEAERREAALAIFRLSGEILAQRAVGASKESLDEATAAGAAGNPG